MREAVTLQAVLCPCIPRGCAKAQPSAYLETLRLSVTMHNKSDSFLTSECVFWFSPYINIY